MRLNFALSTAASTVALGIAAISTPAFAQSTGSVDFEKEIVVTGARGAIQQVAGVSSPDTSKAKAVLTAEAIQRQGAGQTILDTINQIPGVSFQNNDAYGSSGGTLNIRGFDASRISLTFDGIPLNDSGNYAIYSNQQIDPELIEQVNVNLGTTDVDSPTASAVGGTVNYRTRIPGHKLGGMASGSVGEYSMWRLFGMVETGDLTSSGTRAWFAASRTKNDNPFNNYGKVDKQQYNVKLYQPLGGDDFISIAGHYNQNRNNFFGSLPLRWDANRTVGPASSNRFPMNSGERKYNINVPCTIAAGVTGTADAASTCGTEFDRRYNPSNTGNIRINSRFTLADGIVLTVDPYYQYVKANGGGTVTGREGKKTVAGTAYTGFIGGSYYFGKDLNGDGDTLDQVTLIAPSQTQTHRIGVIASLKWDIDPNNTVRVAYTYDRARHRQTGEAGFLQSNGEPVDVFPVNGGITTSDGFLMEKRDRLSFAILQQVAGEYRGEFMDGKLVLNAGVRAPFFRRNLTNYCFTTSAGGFVDCFGQNAAFNAAYAAANPYSFNSATNTVTGYAAPQQRIFNYKKVLPNVGLVYKVAPEVSLFANYSKGLSVPGTDSLYNAFYFPAGTSQASPAPETTDNFDAGVRYRSGMIQGELSGFYNQFHNRLASAYDPELDQTVYRNLGSVKKYGLDGYVSVRPNDAVSFYVFGSYMKSEIQDNIQIGKNADGSPIYAQTAGKRESGAPTSTFGFSARGTLGPIDLGFVAKRTGKRYIYDNNAATYTGSFVPLGAKTSLGTTPTAPAAPTQIFPDAAPGYWLVNLDARLRLEELGLGDKAYLQLNVYNLFDQFYVGGFGGGLIQSNTYSKTTGTASYGSPGFVQIGAPRTVSATLVIGF